MQQIVAALASAAAAAVDLLPLWAVLVILAVCLVVKYPDRIGAALPRLLEAWHSNMLGARTAREANRVYRDRAKANRAQQHAVPTLSPVPQPDAPATGPPRAAPEARHHAG